MPAETTTSGASTIRRAMVISDPAVALGSAGADIGGAASKVVAEISGGFSVDAPLSTYSMATGAISPATTATDIVVINPGARTVRLTYVRITGFATSAGNYDLALVKRSTLDTTGTSSNGVIVPHWSADPASAATATIKIYSVNPGGLGTAVGSIRDDQLFLGSTTAIGFPVEWTFFNTGRALILPGGSTECIAVNAGGVAVPGGTKLNITMTFSEDI